MSEPRTFLDGRVVLHAGDCREVLRGMEDNSVDSVVTDPPYGINFMNRKWDGGDIAFQTGLWADVLRVLKPGGYIMAFSGCRTYHRMACAIEDAGFITHPFFAWATGQGFPKAHSLKNQLHGKICDCERAKTIPEHDLRLMRDADVSSAVPHCKMGNEILFEGMPQQDLQSDRPAPRKSIYVRTNKPGMERWSYVSETPRQLREREICSMPAGRLPINGESGWLRDGASPCDGEVDRASIDTDGMCSSRGPQSFEQRSNEFDALAGQSKPQERGAWPLCDRCGKQIIDADGWFYGTQSLKPAIEPVYFGQKPFERGLNGAQNVLKWGVGAINVGGCRVALNGDYKCKANGRPSQTGLDDNYNSLKANIADDVGRWPANLIHDGSDEVLLACFPETESGDLKPYVGNGHDGFLGGSMTSNPNYNKPGDSGSAARFFYTAKADADDRLGSKHPTVKPLDLIQYLVRLVTPKNGVCLDLFAGTGTTGEACFREGFRAILIEREDEYIADIERRMSLVMEGPRTRAHAGMKARGRPRDDGPLFGGSEKVSIDRVVIMNNNFVDIRGKREAAE